MSDKTYDLPLHVPGGGSGDGEKRASPEANKRVNDAAIEAERVMLQVLYSVIDSAPLEGRVEQEAAMSLAIAHSLLQFCVDRVPIQERLDVIEGTLQHIISHVTKAAVKELQRMEAASKEQAKIDPSLN